MAWTNKATEDQPKRFVEPGDYILTVESAEDKYSKKDGTAMIELSFKLAEGPVIKEWLLDPEAKPDWKWKHDAFALATGLAPIKGAQYTLDAPTLVGLRFKATLDKKTESFTGRDGTQQSATKNYITRYIRSEERRVGK